MYQVGKINSFNYSRGKKKNNNPPPTKQQLYIIFLKILGAFGELHKVMNRSVRYSCPSTGKYHCQSNFGSIPSIAYSK